MPLVKVRTKYQVTLPDSLRRQVRLGVGDLLEAKVEKGKITLTPKSLIDRDIAEGLEDFRRGRFIGPFKTAREGIRALRRAAKRSAAPGNPKSTPKPRHAGAAV
jgi:bifunctional DNA-binding transcriptional regulator/antitoxin component of YhaV-PrlF toxin-antitoxin module